MDSQHFLAAKNIDLPLLQLLLQKTLFFSQQKSPTPLLRNATVANLFFENSTRTRCSFEIAAKKLGAHVINLDVDHSSIKKGESILDTLLTLESLGVNFCIIRHTDDRVFDTVPKNLSLSLINAGAGKVEHPTQGLLDLFTIQQEFKKLNGLNIAICGDIKHSRVASSFMQLMRHYPDSTIKLCGPEYFMPNQLSHHCQQANIDDVIAEVDVVILLRVQLERHHDLEIESDYLQKYGLTHERENKMKKGAIIMHPAPINRDVEIASDLVEHPRSRILVQSKNGVYARMAILNYLWEKQNESKQ